MSELFTKTFHVRWGDMDFNAHMRNTAYLDLSADVRLMYFAEHGFPMREFERMRLGPVIMKEELEYFRELRLLEPVTVTLALAGLSREASRFRIRNDFFKADGTLAARVTSTGGWLDLSQRKLVAPPQKLAEALQQLARSEDYEEIARSAV
ncbi:thioesterase family protein [candidate division KSB1 bacterium]|nr:thioesterase family protein [candidate division KSB1 bacterium]